MSTERRLYAGKVVACLILQGLACMNSLETVIYHRICFGLLMVWITIYLYKLIYLFIQKEKGVFQHSSFLAGGATTAAGKFIVKTGVIKVLLLLCNNAL